jgi:hypothetical protein
MVTKSNILITVILIISTISFVFDASMVFAEKPDPGYPGSVDCSWSGPNDKYQTCCWREKIPGKILGEQYCQKCAWVEGQGYVDCTQKELQMLEQPPNPSPTSLPSSPSAPIQDDSVLEQPDKPNKESLMNLPNSNERTLDN